MPNTYFSRLPLDEAIKTLTSRCIRCEICVTYSSDSIAEDPLYDKWDILRTSTDKREVLRLLREAYALAKRHGGERCKNDNLPKFEDLKKEDRGSYTIFIRYK
jgi:hypothetical protein